MTATATRVAPITDIPPGEGRAYLVGDAQVAVFHLRGGGLRAVSAICPHAGGPLADGQTDSRYVICPLHLNSFDLTTGQSPTGLTPLITYPVELDEQGYVVVGAAQ